MVSPQCHAQNMQIISNNVVNSECICRPRVAAWQSCLDPTRHDRYPIPYQIGLVNASETGQRRFGIGLI